MILYKIYVVLPIYLSHLFLLELLLLSQRRHDGRPKSCHLWSSSSILNRPLWFEYEFIELCWSSLLAKYLLSHNRWIQKFLKKFCKCGLHTCHIDNHSPLGILHPIWWKLFGSRFEHFDWQLFNWKLAHVQNDNPFFNLTWQKHISIDVAGIKVVEWSDAMFAYKIVLEHFLEPDYVNEH